MTQRMQLRIAIYGILYLTFVLGIPSFHYAAALMIAVIFRHRDAPGGLMARIESLPLETRARPA